MRTITVEELDIVVQASVEQALTEFKKIVPRLKKTIKQVEDGLNDMNTKGMTNKVQQAVQQVKQKINEVKNTGVDKQLQSQFDRAGASVQKYQGQLDQTKEKLRQVYAEMDDIQANTWKAYTPEGVELGNKAIEPAVNNDLSSNKQYQSLSKQATKLEEQIVSINAKLNTTKQEYGQIAGQIQQTTAKNSVWNNMVNKVKTSLASLKSNAENIKKSFGQLPSITTKISNKITQMSKGLKQGLGRILRYAGALFSLQTIYSALSSSANAWLSSQNQAAKQLNANIEYMQYAMGSALAPIIQFVTNLVYKLMKAIQSVAYALTGVNIFANASADAYSNMASSASDANKATKQLAGVHSEINNIQSNNNDSAGSGEGAVPPSFDLSQVNPPTNSILDAIKNGNWKQVGVAIGEKLNEAMNSIPWSKIQDGARKIGTGIAEFLNEFIATTDWNKVGDTLAQGINTVIYLGYSFVTTFNWLEFGIAIADSINGAFMGIDWSKAGQTLSNAIVGLLWSVIGFLAEVDWYQLGKSIGDFLASIDWITIIGQLLVILCEAVYGLIMALVGFIESIFQGIGQWLYDNLVQPCQEVFSQLWSGIQEIFSNAGQWFKDKFQQAYDGITSIFQGIGKWFSDIWNDICNIFSNTGSWFKNKFQEAYVAVTSVFKNIGNFFSNIWGNIRNTFSNLGTSIGNAISGAVKSGINGVISLIERTINNAIRLINGGIELINLIPGVNIGYIGTLSLPRLAKGAVLKVPTVAEMAEYPGASTNPEIVTPQNIMEETFDRVLARYQNEDTTPIYLTVNVGNNKLGQILLDDLRNMKRRSGKGIEALVN